MHAAVVPARGIQRRLPELGSGGKAHNLPLPLSSFVGRGEAIAKVRRLLATSRLVTLTGPGGVGKTRLALEVAFAASEERDDGVCWVDLAPLVDAGLVAHTVVRALGLPDDPTRLTVASLNEHLQEKNLLLVLDNCEHLIAECAELAGQLLRHSPRLTLLTTSRESLGIEGETVWTVPPLSLPCLGETPVGENLQTSEAGQLFLERARAVQPDLLLTGPVAQAAAEVCCRLEGIPLAIELAAVRSRVLPVPQIAARLDDLFQLLSQGNRTALPRHQAIETAIEWSYDLLTRPEQVLFERLGVLVGGFRLEAAEAVAGDRSGTEGLAPAEVLGLLSNLVLKSLVVVREGEPVRYGMLETIRRYAWKRLSASGELERMRQRHLAYYVELAEQAEGGLGGEDQVVWLRLLEAEQDNLRAALRWSEESGDPQAGLRLAAALAPFWLRVGFLSEGSGWLARALAACSEPEGVAACSELEGPVRVKALYQAGWLAQMGGDYERALSLARQSLVLSRRFEDKKGMARALSLVGWITHAQGDREGASPLLEEGLALARESGDQRTLALTLLFLGDLWLRQGALEPAAGLLEESLRLYQGMADRWGMAWAYGGLGEIARLEGDYEQALARLQLGLVLYQELGGRPEIPYLLESLALAAADQGQFRRAALLWGASSSLRHAVHAPLHPSYEVDYEATLNALNTALGERDFAVTWAEGRAMTLDEALALAAEAGVLAEANPAQQPIGAEASASALSHEDFGLTPREVEVLRLVATGLTDAQVGERLVISPRTVGKHLQSIYSKLYVHSRSAVTRWALEHGLD